MRVPPTTSDCYLHQVAARVRMNITEAGGTVAFQRLLLHLLARPGRVLAPDGAAKWPAFVLDICRALNGNLEVAIDAAAAVEFAVAAIDVLDDVIDDEWEGDAASQARASNAGLALGWLAQRCASRLAAQLGAAGAQRIGDLIARGGLASCAGQDSDLVLESVPDVTENLAHEMTRCKSGSLVAMACQVGAAVATDDPAVLEAVGGFGEHVGIVAQLLNDLAGVDPEARRRGSDLRRRKKTLPVAYALECARQEDVAPLRAWYERSPESYGREESVARSIEALGGHHFTWVVAEAHRREALTALRSLGRRTGRAETSSLRRLVPPVRLRTT